MCLLNKSAIVHVSKQIAITAKSTKETVTKRSGRPLVAFDNASTRSKRRKVAEMQKQYNVNQLSSATISSSFRKCGNNKAVNTIIKVTTNEVKNTQTTITPLTSEEVFNMIITKLSKENYKFIRAYY